MKIFFIVLALLLAGCITQEEVIMNKKAVMIIAHENFRDEELFQTKEVLERSGITIEVASTSKGTARGMLGATYDVGMTIDEIDPNQFDAIIFVGGSGASSYYNNEKAKALARAFFHAGKPVAAICIAPGILAEAGILDGKKATIWNGDGQFANMIKKANATYLDQDVVVDGNIITANGPHAARRFAEAIISALK